MTTRQIAYRLKSEGKAELLRDQREVADGFKGTYAAAEAGAAAASTATERQEKRFRQLAQAAREAEAAAQSQARVNSLLGVSGSGRSASESASVFIANDNDAARADAIRASIDPLWAAQRRYNEALEETRRLQKGGHLEADVAIQKENQLQQELNQTTEALKRRNGLTGRQLQGRASALQQVADIGVTGAMGMNPLMIGIQQGPQLLTALADAGIKLTPVLIGLTAATAAAAAGAVILAAGWAQGSKDAAAYELAATGIGRTAGLTAEQLNALVKTHAEVGEVSIASARDQATAYLATGRIGGEVIGRLIDISRDYSAFMGVDAADATKSLAAAMLDPVKAGEEMTRTFGLLTQAEMDQIEAAMKAGDQMRAQETLLAALDKALEGHADKVDEATTAWQALGRWMSNVWTRTGEALHETEQERLRRLIGQRAASERRGLDELDPTQRAHYDAAGREAWALQQRLRQEASATSADTATRQANQAAQLDEDRAKAAERAGRGAARAAEAEARRQARERERAAKEALQRSRRDEDRDSAVDIEVARLDGRSDIVQELQDEVALRNRIRELVDADVLQADAETKALAEQARILAARADAAQDEALVRATGLELQAASARGDYATAQDIQTRVDWQETFNTQLGIWHSKTMAILVTDLEIAAAATERADAMERSVKAARDEHQLAVARLAGRDSEVRSRELEERIERRARDIERRESLDHGAGDSRARTEIREEVDAEAEGVRRSWTKSFVDDIRRGGIREALAEQFENATDRLINKLIDGLFDIDWAAIINGGGSGGGASGPNIGSWVAKGLDWLIGRNADGTDNWRGGLTWVGERGPELINAPRGSQIIDHGRSMRMLAAGTSGGGQTVHNHFTGNLLTPEFWAEINRRDGRAASAGASRGAQAAVGFVQGSAPSVQRGARMLKD